jgi:hypothetical protein
MQGVSPTLDGIDTLFLNLQPCHRKLHTRTCGRHLFHCRSKSANLHEKRGECVLV